MKSVSRFAIAGVVRPPRRPRKARPEPVACPSVQRPSRHWRNGMKGGLLWLIGIPIPIIILLYLFGVL